MTNLQRGCQSTTHPKRACRGDLWTCDTCKRTLCYADGQADDEPELCDTCWVEKQKEDGQ